MLFSVSCCFIFSHSIISAVIMRYLLYWSPNFGILTTLIVYIPVFMTLCTHFHVWLLPADCFVLIARTKGDKHCCYGLCSTTTGAIQLICEYYYLSTVDSEWIVWIFILASLVFPGPELCQIYLRDLDLIAFIDSGNSHMKTCFSQVSF